MNGSMYWRFDEDIQQVHGVPVWFGTSADGQPWLQRMGFSSVHSDWLEALASQDCVLIVTDHSSYDYEWIVKHAPLVVDTRGATRAVEDRTKIWTA